MRKLTTWDQANSMRRVWPEFRMVERKRDFVMWVGPLRPFCQTYSVCVAYRRDPRRGMVDECRPCVTVTDPLVHRRDEAPNDPIPHHYPNSRCPERPFLCLYDPRAGEWRPAMSIAKTIVPWTIDWLACYEGWLATGEWTGGGRHPTSE